MSLKAALEPKSVVIVGASEDINKIGGRPIRFMQQFGFQGRIHALNPNRSIVQGIATIASLDDLPEIPDMAVIAVPAAGAVDAVERCAALGVKVCLILTSGFAEIADPAGAETEQRMLATARAAGMRLIGPNSQGLANFSNGSVPGFSTMFAEYPPLDGPVGIVSQSGAMAGLVYGQLRMRGIGVRHAHATGNDCDVTAAELALEMAGDPDIKMVMLYIETIRDAAPLIALGKVAHERKLPVVILKGGATDLGQIAARSHTAALANEDRAVDAFLAAAGLSRARSVAELIATTRFHLNGWKPSGRKVVVISNSGASCVLAADALSDHGLELARLKPETGRGLAEILPGFASVVNPVDITAALLSNSGLFSQILPVIASDPSADGFVIAIPVSGEGYDFHRFGRDVAAFAAATGKPVTLAVAQPRIAEVFEQIGLPVFPFEHEAVAALAAFINQCEQADAPVTAQIAPPLNNLEPRMMSEAESLAVLDRHDLPTAPYRLCHSAQQAADAARHLGGRVVVKGISPAVPHKSELGLVRVGLSDPAAVAVAYDEMVAILKREGHSIEGVLVAGMVQGRRELIVGGHRDPVLGPMVVVGDGGKYVETLKDTVVVSGSASPEAIHDAIGRLRIAPILQGTRGEPPAATDALVRLVRQVGALLLDGAEGIESIDLNPVFIDTEGVTIADALIVARAPASGQRDQA